MGFFFENGPNNQHINFKLIYQKGAKNQSDYLSRKSLPFDDNNAEEKEAAEEICSDEEEKEKELDIEESDEES